MICVAVVAAFLDSYPETCRMDIAGWLEKNAPIAAADLLPTASGSAPAKVTVELVDGDDKDARLKKEAEADAKRSVCRPLSHLF